METIIVLLIIYAVFVFVMIRGAYDEKKRKQKYRNQLKNLYGSFPQTVCSAEEIARIESGFRHFFNGKALEGMIDDITWNDLNMDSIFARMNFTQSSAGEETLYAMLRHPALSNDRQEKYMLEQHIAYMTLNETMRLDAMMLLDELGKSGKYALADYLDFIKELGIRSNLKHYLCILFLIGSLVSVFAIPSLGVALLIAAACFNIVTYMNEKGVASTYVTAFSYIMRMLECADGIIALGLGSEFTEYTDTLKKKRERFKSFEKNSGMVLKLNSATGSVGGILFDYIKMLTHIDLIQFNKMLGIIQRHEKDIYEIAESIGYLDAVISIDYFRAALPYSCVPVLTKGKNDTLVIKDAFHPCLENPVANSISQNRGMLVTGSNASGKSTFLKTVAINAILAQSISICCAKAYSGNYYRIYSSMSLRDSLESGESYYMVEIKALKRIIDAADTECQNPLLCFVDEVLRGTNTVERIAASVQILKKLSKRGIFCFAATHDIELTKLLVDEFDNCHFEEEVKDGDVLFSYRLLPGRSHTRNAIKLLEIIGFSKDIIKQADNMAGDFLRTGEWRKV
ncbi:MAG: hypothetical protein HDR19_01835 [Lachnospiraceae bacterium]|nr:hypothetical protein [Lachnospiraceae bacterium]